MEGQNGYMISGDELFFFNERPAALPLYEAFAQRIFDEIDNVSCWNNYRKNDHVDLPKMRTRIQKA